MRPIRHTLLCAGVCGLMACGDDAPSGDSTSRLAASEFPEEVVAVDGSAPVDAGRVAGDAAVPLPDAGSVTDLSCPRGGNTGPVRVVFACDRITVITCKDLSNVVIELDDGSRQRVEGLQGHQNAFGAPSGRTIAGVWVKAGENGSGEGPGYGVRVDAPSNSCSDAGSTAPDGGTAGDASTGDAGTTNPPPATPPQEPPPAEPPAGPGIVG